MKQRRAQKILDFLGKGITVEQIERAFGWVNEVGINGGMFLIIGIPGETQEDSTDDEEVDRRMQAKYD